MDDGDLLLPIEVVPMGDDLVAVFVRGEIDLTEAGELRAVLSDACTDGHRSVLVDLSGVRFMGSRGLGVLAHQHKMMADAGRALSIVGCSTAMLRAFAITGLDRVLDVS